MTYADRIRRMTDEELRKFLHEVATYNTGSETRLCIILKNFGIFPSCYNMDKCEYTKECWECILEWLKMEVDENDRI